MPQEAFQGRQYGKRESLKKLSDELNTKKEMQLQHACKHSSVGCWTCGQQDDALVVSEIFSLNQFIGFGRNGTLCTGTERL